MASKTATGADGKVLEKIYGEYIDFTSSENTVKNYTKLASDYERDFVGMGYDTPGVLAMRTVEQLGSNTEDTVLFDACCGTGLVADGLLKAGFKGKVDGVDGSKGMLEVAESKNVYRNLKEAFIYADKPMEVEAGAYDGVVVCGGFGPGHLEPEVLEEFLRITKAGGLVVFATRFNEHANDYVRQLDAVIARLASEGKWSLKSVFKSKYFDVDFCNRGEALMAKIYCYQKSS